MNDDGYELWMVRKSGSTMALLCHAKMNCGQVIKINIDNKR